MSFSILKYPTGSSCNNKMPLEKKLIWIICFVASLCVNSSHYLARSNAARALHLKSQGADVANSWTMNGRPEMMAFVVVSFSAAFFFFSFPRPQSLFGALHPSVQFIVGLILKIFYFKSAAGWPASTLLCRTQFGYFPLASPISYTEPVVCYSCCLFVLIPSPKP